jgi:hypothetical protein
MLSHTNGIQIGIAFTWLWNLNYPIKRPSGNSLIEFWLNNANWWLSNSIYLIYYIEEV